MGIVSMTAQQSWREEEENAVFEMEITGGTGRFLNATGNFVGKFDGIPGGPPVYDPGALLAETGTIKGWIEQ